MRLSVFSRGCGQMWGWLGFRACVYVLAWLSRVLSSQRTGRACQREEEEEAEEEGANQMDPLHQLITLFSHSALTERRCVCGVCVCVVCVLAEISSVFHDSLSGY